MRLQCRAKLVATVDTPSRVFAYEWQAKDLRDTECVRAANKGVTGRRFCTSAQDERLEVRLETADGAGRESRAVAS
jgi:hypothetical protein